MVKYITNKFKNVRVPRKNKKNGSYFKSVDDKSYFDHNEFSTSLAVNLIPDFDDMGHGIRKWMDFKT